jgi:hypothetical protein
LEEEMKKVILVLAVAAVFAFSGTVMASPPVCPPFEGFLIETETSVNVIGNMSEEESFDWTWNNDYCQEGTSGIDDNELVENEIVGRISYTEDFDSFNGLEAEQTTFNKEFTANSHPDGSANLTVEKDIGYTSDTIAGHHASFKEIASEEVVAAGGEFAGQGMFAGVLALCPWATTSSDTPWPATNEGIVMGSKFAIPAVLSNGDAGYIDFASDTEVGVTKGVYMTYDVTATGKGLMQAEMIARLWEGSTAATAGNLVPALNSKTTYTEKTVADGIFDFHKGMLYRAKFEEPEITPIGLEILQ